MKKIITLILVAALTITSCTKNVEQYSNFGYKAALAKQDCKKGATQLESQLVSCEKAKILEYAKSIKLEGIDVLRDYYTDWEKLAHKYDNEKITKTEYQKELDEITNFYDEILLKAATDADNSDSNTAANIGAAVAALAAIAALAAVAANGGGGGGYDYTPYQNQDNRGCCSWHGGICGYNLSRPMCCDGTASPTCY